MAEANGGLTIPVGGVGGEWIVKLPSTKFNAVPENEFAMLNLARAVGIDVPEIQLVDPSDVAGLPDEVRDLPGRALAIKRFDRLPGGEAIHIEDFAQVFGVYPEKKYDRASYKNIAEVLWAEDGGSAIEEFTRRLVFNALIGNGDMHLKNWSLIYPDGRKAEIAPAYDFVSTVAYLPRDKMALNFVRSKDFASFSLDRLSRFAAAAKLPEKLVLGTARETTSRFLTEWGDRKHHLDLSNDQVAAIDKHLNRIPLAQDD